MVYVLFNVRENDIFVICIKRYNLLGYCILRFNCFFLRFDIFVLIIF